MIQLEDNLKTLIKTNAFLGYNIIIEENMGFFKCPRIDDLKENLMIYIYLFNKYIDLYEDDKSSFYYVLFLNEKYFQEFASMLYFFFQTEQIKLKDQKLYFNEKNFMDENNISIFMESLRVLHHFDKKNDDYKPANKIAAEMMARARKLKKEMEAKIKQKDGIGFLEIMSTVSARHASINPTNIGQLNYYQIIDQYKRLMMIDIYTPCLYGNATEEYIKKNNVKHYSLKIINE
ncbi:MAG: hypothetical protein PHT02_00185 [Tissierellia bacterium]|nr:hypothetical protein [Tissierellia bacterium]